MVLLLIRVLLLSGRSITEKIYPIIFRQLSGFLEVLVSYHGISKLTIAKMAGVEEQDIERLLTNPLEKVEIEVKYKIAQQPANVD